MGKYCVLCNAKSQPVGCADVVFHKFPFDDKQYKLWKEICGFSARDDVTRSALCSDHFADNAYVNIRAREFGGRLTLKPGAFPSVNVPNESKVPFCLMSAPVSVPPSPTIIITPISNTSKFKIETEYLDPTLSKHVVQELTQNMSVFTDTEESKLDEDETVVQNKLEINPSDFIIIADTPEYVHSTELAENASLTDVEKSSEVITLLTDSETESVYEIENTDPLSTDTNIVNNLKTQVNCKVNFSTIHLSNSDPETEEKHRIPIKFEQLSNLNTKIENDNKIQVKPEYMLNGNDVSSSDRLIDDKIDVSFVRKQHGRYGPRFAGDITIESFSTPGAAKISLNILKNQIEKQRKEIKRLNNKVRRSVFTITRLKEKVDELKKQQQTTEDIEKQLKKEQRKAASKKETPIDETDILTIHSYSKSININGFKCEINDCQMEFRHRRLLEMHVHRHHRGSHLYLCSICGKGFNKTFLLGIHEKRHAGEKDYLCELCDRTFYCKVTLKKHQNKVHFNVRYSCKLCSKSFTSIQQRHRHQLAHTGIKAHKCNMCKSSFYTGTELTFHKKCRHQGVKRFKCNICDKAYYMGSALYMHSKCHPENWKFVCEEADCGKRFQNEEKLNLHINSHFT